MNAKLLAAFEIVWRAIVHVFVHVSGVLLFTSLYALVIVLFSILALIGVFAPIKTNQLMERIVMQWGFNIGRQPRED